MAAQQLAAAPSKGFPPKVEQTKSDKDNQKKEFLNGKYNFIQVHPFAGGLSAVKWLTQNT